MQLVFQIPPGDKLGLEAGDFLALGCGSPLKTMTILLMLERILEEGTSTVGEMERRLDRAVVTRQLVPGEKGKRINDHVVKCNICYAAARLMLGDAREVELGTEPVALVTLGLKTTAQQRQPPRNTAP